MFISGESYVPGGLLGYKHGIQLDYRKQKRNLSGVLLVFKKGCTPLHEDGGRAASGVRVVGASGPCLQGIAVLKVPGT